MCIRDSRSVAPKPFKIDQDNLRMKCSALNVDFNGVRFEPRFKESSIRAHQIDAVARLMSISSDFLFSPVPGDVAEDTRTGRRLGVS